MAITLADRAAAARQTRLNQTLLKVGNQSIFSLSRISQNEVQNAQDKKWSVDDKELIDWVLKHFHAISIPIMGKAVWNKILQALASGPWGPLAKSGEFQDGLRFLRQVIEDNLQTEKAKRITGG